MQLPPDTPYIKPLVICGPSGAGKSTLFNHLNTIYASKIQFSISCTTRQPRPGEENGVHYHFITVEQFRDQLNQQKFIEHAEVHGNYYGSHLDQVKNAIES